MQYIDKLYYINLAYRTDRNEQINSWLRETNIPVEKIQRIDAIHTPESGNLGCTASHVKALETFLESDAKICCIFEDDYTPINTNTYWSTVQQVFDHNVDFDCVLLSYNFLKSTPSKYSFLEHVQESYTASGYIITREFAPRLIGNLKECFILAVDEQTRTGGKTHQYCSDVYWAKLMAKTNKWFVFKPRIGIQAASYSDIEGHMVDHGV